MSAPVCLFAYYSTEAGLPPHTRHLLSQIATCGFTIHIAASGLSETEAQSLHDDLASGAPPVSATVHARPNTGLDFGAWQFLLSRGCDRDADEILFANDSVFGPLLPLNPIVERMRAQNLQIWGMVRSEAVVPHLQSWFLCMTREALDHPAIQRIFNQPFSDMSKDEIVLHGELGLGLAIKAAGLSCGAAWSNPRGLARLLALNPMHTDWRAVLRSGHAPFIKTELLRDNPSGIASTHLWRQEIPDPAFFNPDWIARYLAATPPRNRSKRAGFRARLIQALASEDRRHALIALLLGR
ncbi:rhamnan synthesis F family protein [Gluconobacter oxydans]|uniref:rhamnan synthesis F family protein n=1 Tax=Gluconobacter oxydans TaxID=442 RepID=UPI0039EC4486